MADCEYQIGGQGKFYSESEFKKLLSEGYLDKVMLENQVKIRGIKPNEELAKSFQLPSAIQAQAPIEAKDNYKVAQEVTAEVSKENPDASVLLTPKGEDLSLTAVYVGKENRGKGIGTKVLESVKKQADKLGKKIVLDATTELDEETDLGRLENFYQNNGFTKVGENKFEYNPTEPVTKTEEKVTEPTVEEQDKVAEKAGITPKNFRDLYKVNRDLFGLDRLKSFTNAIAMDRMIGTMARRAGVDKSEMYGRLQFEKDTEENVLKAENALFQGVINGENVNLKNVDVDVVNGFYSNTEKALSQVKQEKMSGNQWATQLLSRGANKEEMSWTGLQDYLKENASNSISKSDINQFLKDNRINIVEILKSEDGKLSSFYTDPDESNEKLDFLSSLDKDNLFVKQVTGGKWNIYSKSTPQRAILMGINSENEANDIILNPEKYKGREPIGRTKYSGYQLEGQKENYKEILITMPDKMDAVKDYNFKLIEYNNFVKGLGVPTQQEKDQANEMQSELDALKLKLPKNVSYQQGFAYVNEKFKSSHFDEPNILVHLRMNTRIDSDGKKVLFIEEVQSDWGQQGKKQGFGESERLKKTRVNLSEAKESLAKANEKLIEANKSGDEYDKKWYSNSVEKWGELINNYEKQIESLENTNRDNTPTAPFVTDTNAWTKLGLKVALKQAVNQGADRIAWTTGEQQNERYDLRKQVDEVNYYKTEDGRYHITADKDGISISSGIYKENELEGILGKEVAKKIIDNEGENVDKYNSAFGYDEFGSNQKYKSLKGENLAIGGKGMKGFYGSPKEGSLGIVGNVIKGLTKQEPKTVEIDAGGEKIGKATKDFDDLMQSLQFEKELKNNGKKGIVSTVNKDGSYTVEWNENNPSTQYSIDITPEIKADVQKGLALFQKEQGKKAKGAMVAADSSFVIYALTDPNVSTPLHELAHVYEHYLTDAERNKILKAAGTDTWNTKTSEYFARGFEKYLAEGKSPVESLNKVFEKFKEWLTDIYSGIKNSEIDVKLNKDMKAIYDTILKEGDTKSTAKTKQPTREAVTAKNLADYLRTGKMEKGTAMALPLPGFDKLWNGTIETVAKAIEVGGVTAGNLRQSIEAGMKALKQTDAYKAITDPKERAKISREYKKQLLEKIPQFYNIDTDNLREAEFNDFNQKLEESKGKTLSNKEFNALKAEAKKFVNDNLPADSYKKSEVQSYVRNNFDKAKTVEDIQKNLDKVNSIMTTKEAKIQKETEKQAAKDKKTLIKEIEGKIAANSRKVISKNRRTGAKKGKITLGSQQQINQLIQDLKDQGLFKNLDKMTDQELVTLNETIDNILTTGRAEQKQINAIEEAKKRTDKAMILESLSDKPDKYLDGQEEIMEALDKESGIVIVDGQAMNKGAFEEYAKQNPDAELETVPFYYRRDAKEIKEDLKRDKTFRKGLRNITLFTVRDLETYIRKLGSGSKEFRTWLEESIAKPIREGRLKSVETVWNKTREYQKATKKIFGTDALGRNKMYDTLVEVTDIKPKNSKANLSAGQVVHLYGILNNPDKDKAEANAKRLQKYNGISAKEVIDFMENPDNKVLMDYYNFLKDKYNVEFRAEFGPSIEQLHNIVLEDKYYYPEPASGAATESENILDLENKTVSLSAIAPNMRHRKDAVSVPFELTDAHEMFLRYVQSMAHAKEFIPATKAAYTLLSDMNKPYVMEKFGSVTEYNDFVKTLSIAVTDNTPYQTDAFTSVNNWTALTLLWFRLKAVPQQLSAFVHYYGAGIKDGVMPWDVARALPVTKNDFQFVKDFYFDNPYLYTRLSGGNITPEMQALKNQIDSNVNKYKRGILNAVQFVGLFPIKGGDAMSSASPGGGMSFALAQFRNKYNETGDYELSKQFAKQRWMEETERTQQPSLAKEAISTASYNNVVRLLIPFSSAQNAIAKKSYKAYTDIFKDWNNLDTNEKTQAVSDLIYYPVFGNMPFILTGGLGFALWRMLFDDEEDDTLKDSQKKRMYYDLMMETIQANATSAGVLGKSINTFINIARDKEFFNEVPLLQKGIDISKLAYEIFLVDNDLSEMTKEQRLKFYQEHSGADDPLGRTDFANEQEYNEWVENVYKPTPFYKKMTEKEISLAKKVSGFNNLFTMVKDIKDFAASEKGINDIIKLTTGSEQKRNKLNKNLDPYFNQAIQFDKQDKLFKKIYDEDYIIKEIDEKGFGSSKDIRSAIKDLKPKRPRIPRPR